MIKLDKQVASLEAVQDRIEDKINELQERMDAIQERADEMDRNLTDAEHKRYYKLFDEAEELQYEYDEINNAIDYLKDFCENY